MFRLASVLLTIIRLGVSAQTDTAMQISNLKSPLGSAASLVEETSNLRSALSLRSSKKPQISNLKS